MYSLFKDQCKPSLKTKIKGTKGNVNAHNAQDRIKLPDLIRSSVYGVETHLQGTWAMMKSDKRLYMLLQRKNKKNDYMKYFDAYIKVIYSYGGKTPIHPGLVKATITKMIVQDTNNPIP